MTGRTEILLAHAWSAHAVRRRVARLHPLPPLQPAQVAAWLEQEAGAEVRLWDPTFRLGTECFEVAVSRLRPRVAWIHTHPATRPAALAMVGQARRCGAAVIAGGPDASLRPAAYLRAGADAVVPGEAEGETLALLLALRGNRYRPAPEILGRVPGVHYMGPAGSVGQAPDRFPPVDLARIPPPLRDPEQTRIHLEQWLAHGRPRTLALASARGCPNRCGFCTQRVFGRPYRRRAPEDVVAEIADLASRFEVDRLRFSDELFLFDRAWLRELAHGLGARSLHVAFEGSAHPSHLDPDTVALLAGAGMARLDLRAASGSADLLRRLGWGYGPADVYRAAAAIRRAGVALVLQVHVGLPGETRADLEATLQMVRVIQPDGVDVTRVDPGSRALSGTDWEMVADGPVARMAGTQPPLPGALLDAAASWMRSIGPRGEVIRGPLGLAGLIRGLRRPLLRALVTTAPLRLLPESAPRLPVGRPA